MTVIRHEHLWREMFRFNWLYCSNWYTATDIAGFTSGTCMHGRWLNRRAYYKLHFDKILHSFDDQTFSWNLQNRQVRQFHPTAYFVWSLFNPFFFFSHSTIMIIESKTKFRSSVICNIPVIFNQLQHMQLAEVAPTAGTTTTTQPLGL